MAVNVLKTLVCNATVASIRETVQL